MARLDICCLLLVLTGFAYGQELTDKSIDVVTSPEHTSPKDLNELHDNHNNETTSMEAYNSASTQAYTLSLAEEIIKHCGWRMACLNRCSIKITKSSPGFSSDVPSSFSSTSPPSMPISRKKRQTNDHPFPGHENMTASRMCLSNRIDSLPNSGKGDTSNESDVQGLRSRRSAETEESVCMPYDPVLDPVCYCDEDCFVYGDCCADVFESCLGLVEPDDISSFLSDHAETFNTFPTDDLSQALTHEVLDTDLALSRYLSEYGTCVEINQTAEVGAIIIHKCPHDFIDKDLQKKCQEPDSPLLPPVTANVNGNFLPFKNIFCAQCHNIVDSIIPWKPVLACSEDLNTDVVKPFTVEIITGLVRDQVCNVNFNPPTDGMCSLRHCYPKSFLTVEKKQTIEKNEEIGMCTSLEALLCKTYLRPIDGHKNLHCKMCLEHSVREKRNILSMGTVSPTWECMTKSIGVTDDDFFGGGILIILDITGSFTYHEDGRRENHYICADNQVLDPYTHECKRLECQRSFEPFRGQCIKTTDAFIVDGATQIFPDAWDTMYLHFATDEVESSCNTTCSALSPVFPKLVKNTPDIQISKVLVFTNKRVDQCTYIKSKLTDFEIDTEIDLCQEISTDVEMEVTTNVEIHLNILSSLDRDTMDQLHNIAENNLVTLVSKSGNSVFIFTNMADLNATDDICPQGLIAKRRTDFSVTEYKGILYAVLNSSDIEISYPLLSVGYEIEVSINKSHTTMKETIIVCDESELFSRKGCKIIAYWLNETTQNGTQIVISKTQRMYEPGDYEISGDKVFVCTNFPSALTERFLNDTVYLVISWVFTVLSIIFLLIMLIIYAMFPELCNLPGKLTASLAATMMLTFVANLFTLVDLHNDYICPVAAALTHLVTLAHYGWMAAISVNMAITFGFWTTTKTSSLNGGKTFLRYNMVVWSLSAAIVLTSVILDLTHREPYGRTNYTKDSEEEGKSEDVSGFPRYGYPYCTWFSGDMWTRLAFLIVPFFITYIMSVTGFVITLVGIQRASKSSAKLGKQSSDRTLCLIYLKLSTAMGFSWILSLVLTAFPEITALRYCYVILVLLQGVLLFLAFMVNKRVYRLITKKFTSQTSLSSKPATQTSKLMSNTVS